MTTSFAHDASDVFRRVTTTFVFRDRMVMPLISDFLKSVGTRQFAVQLPGKKKRIAYHGEESRMAVAMSRLPCLGCAGSFAIRRQLRRARASRQPFVLQPCSCG